jgi:predicted phosphodiesterase
MRFAILSDIHGNLPALEAVLADIASQSVDQILIAGDLVAGCPYPRETVQLLRSLEQSSNSRCIRGNNETYILNFHRRTCHPDMLTSLQWGATRWAFEQLTPADLEWIANLPAEISIATSAGGIRMVHGSLEGEYIATVPDRSAPVIAQMQAVNLLKPGQIFPPLSATLAGIDEQVLICGHIHIPWLQHEGQKLGLNPGSVGMPINSDPRTQYALLTTQAGAWAVEFRALEYERARVQRHFQTSGLLAAGNGFARAGMLDLERAQNTVWQFIRHTSATANAHGVTGPLVPDAVWAEAIASFNWGEPPTQ